MANTASVLPSAFREGFAVNIAPVHSSRNDTASISGTVSGVASLNIVALESVTVSPIVRLSAELANRTSIAVYPLGTTGEARAMAEVTMRFDAEIVSATRDAEGRVIAGDPNRSVETHDIWTFSRHVKSPDPAWLLIATDEEA